MAKMYKCTVHISRWGEYIRDSVCDVFCTKTYLVDMDRPISLTFIVEYWSGSTLFVIQYAYLYQYPGASNLIGWKVEVGMAS